MFGGVWLARTLSKHALEYAQDEALEHRKAREPRPALSSLHDDGSWGAHLPFEASRAF